VETVAREPGNGPLLLPPVAVQLLDVVRRRNRRVAQLLGR
jgi:hypothetical protein